MQYSQYYVLFQRKIPAQGQPHPAQLRHTVASRNNTFPEGIRSFVIYRNVTTIQAYWFEVPVGISLTVNISNC